MGATKTSATLQSQYSTSVRESNEDDPVVASKTTTNFHATRISAFYGSAAIYKLLSKWVSQTSHENYHFNSPASE
jgi:hypothetical protein